MDLGTIARNTPSLGDAGLENLLNEAAIDAETIQHAHEMPELPIPGYSTRKDVSRASLALAVITLVVTL